MPVHVVSDGMRVDPNHVYVIPANASLALSQRILRLAPREATAGLHMPIDGFLRSLAENRGNGAIGVILSGSGSDGALGLEAIKSEGGITFAQDEKSAQFADMPRNAVATGCVDFVLAPEEIARKLARIGRHPYLQDLLIKVTQFFRDPEVFDALNKLVFPQLLQNRSAKAPI